MRTGRGSQLPTDPRDIMRDPCRSQAEDGCLRGRLISENVFQGKENCLLGFAAPDHLRGCAMRAGLSSFLSRGWLFRGETDKWKPFSEERKLLTWSLQRPIVRGGAQCGCRAIGKQASG